MDVHLVGGEPVLTAVTAALDDVDVGVVDAEPTDIETADFGIVTAITGTDTFTRANDAARMGDTPWIAIEIGGIGGHPIQELDAAISGFGPRTGCYECLERRVESTTRTTAESPSAGRSEARLAGAIAGRETVRVFAGEGTILGQVLEVPHARRRVLPVPNCVCDRTDRERTVGRDDDHLPLAEVVELADAAIDDRLGPVTTLGETESFPAPYYLASTADTSGFSDANAPEKSAGVAEDWNAAMMKAIGESLERYCGAVYTEDDFVHASYDELESSVSPTDIVRPADSPAFDSDSDCRWVPGENLETGESTHLPAAAVQFPQPGERIVPAITTGMGLGSSTVGALVSGLTEVIERDATMLSWYSTDEPVGLDVEDETFETLERRANSEGLTVTPQLVTQDIDVPVVSVAVHRDPEDSAWPSFAVGSAASLNGIDGARAALEEALQNWMELRAIGPEEASEQSGAIGEYGSFPQAAQEFVDVERTVEADAIGPDTVPTGAEALSELVEQTTAAGLTPYAARLTTRDVETLGFEAVRVVVPGAQPLFTGEPYFGERARTVPTERGFESRLDRTYHPYP